MDSEDDHAGGSVLPLAPLTDLPPSDLPAVIQEIENRLQRESPIIPVAELWAATLILLGLRFPPEFAAQLLRGVQDMEESSTYQMILARGEARGEAKGLEVGRLTEARGMLYLFGELRLGPPTAAVRVQIDVLRSVAEIEALAVRLMKAESWEELLTPEAGIQST